MKFTLSWLNDHLEHNKSVSDLIDALTVLGIEVEEVINYGEKLKDFSVGYIKNAKPHPNADKLQICDVDTKFGQLQIVCGAKNARAGIYVIFAPSGTFIPGLSITLKDAQIRGIDSFGMMLSQKELGISDEHGEIIELGNSVVGLPAADALNLNDVLFDVSITPNRGDLLGVRSIAKDLHAYGFGILKDINFSMAYDSIIKTKSPITLEINSDIASRFMLLEIRDIDNNAILPSYMVNRLHMIGQKSINPIVDLINYICIDLNQPMHAYDMDKLQNINNVSVIYGKDGDKLITLDGVENNITNIVPLVCFGDHIGAIAGIKGAMDSGCDVSTKNILLEIANFNHEIIAFAKRQLSINTDSAYRFERKIDTKYQHSVECAVDLISNYLNGRVVSVSIYDNTIIRDSMNISLDYINNLIGSPIAINDIIKTLKDLDFTIVNHTQDSINIIPASHRHYIENQSDVVSDIIRILLKGNIASIDIMKNIQESNVAYNDKYLLEIVSKKSLASLSMIETINMSFISQNLADIFQINNKELNLVNPISIDLSVMRQSLIPSLAQVALNNINNGIKEIEIFEVANIYNIMGEQQLVASALISGKKQVQNWHGKLEYFDVWDIKDKLFSFLSTLGINPVNLMLIQSDLPSYYHMGLSGKILMGKDTTIATFGKLHPMVIKNMDLKEDIFTFEVFLENLPINLNSIKKNIKIPNLMPIERDFAFIFDKKVTAGEILKLTKSVNKQLISDVSIFDVYEGDKIPQGTKSIALRVKIQSYDKTLVENEIHDISNSIINTLQSKLNGKLRDK